MKKGGVSGVAELIMRDVPEPSGLRRDLVLGK